jgi:hypothetical protein
MLPAIQSWESRSSGATTPNLPATADLSLSNVVPVAKNDQLYNPINLNRKEKGTYQRIW